MWCHAYALSTLNQIIGTVSSNHFYLFQGEGICNQFYNLAKKRTLIGHKQHHAIIPGNKTARQPHPC